MSAGTGETGTAAATPARCVAFTVLRRVFEQGAYADRTLEGEVARAALDPRERAFATRLAYGAVQRAGTLDHLIGKLAKRPVARLDPPLRAALRLGLYQLGWLDGVAQHAAVSESVELARSGAPAGAGLVNAVLRRATRELPGLLAALDDSTPAGAAIAHSVPPWLAELWFAELGAEEARALLRAVNEPAEAAARANSLRGATPASLIAAGLPARPGEEPPESLVFTEAFDVHGSPAWAAGELVSQSRAAQLVARALAPEGEERVLDLCAAPGGKTTHLAALMADRGTLVAVERHAGRADALRSTCTRAGATIVQVEVGDAAGYRTRRQFDRVLVDPPCSGLGTLQGRPDLRWRASPGGIERLAELQASILAAGARALRPGGTLVYSTCTLSRRENEQVIAGAPALGLELEHERVTLPHRDGTDGFFTARLRRVSG